MSSRERIDVLLVKRGLVETRQRAQARLMAGDVFVAGQRMTKAGTRVPADAEVELKGGGLVYVSRGGLKLEQALDAFEVDPTGRICMDVGASTGGFTDCLLQRGAAKVYAVDVGYGQLAWKLRNDERVVVHERCNIRKLAREAIPEEISLAVIDCSFIGLDKVLPPTRSFLGAGAEVLCLVKPQFEVGRENIGSRGVVRDPGARRDAIDAVRDAARRVGFEVRGGVDCDTHGPNGNVEYLLWLALA